MVGGFFNVVGFVLSIYPYKNVDVYHGWWLCCSLTVMLLSTYPYNVVGVVLCQL